MFHRILLHLALGMTFCTAPGRAAVTNFVRPDFQNLSGPGTIAGRDPNPGLILMQGLIKPVSGAPNNGGDYLTEVSFGQPFSPFVFQLAATPANTYAAEIIAQVRSVLYPPVGATRADVLASPAAFRYKSLLFSTEPGSDDVTTHFQSMTNWFGNPERALVDRQIAVLRDALAVSPLDTSLRGLLLDCYYDLAVAEMQFTKQSLAGLAATHLGLTLSGGFVIDAEITIYETIINLESKVLAKYAELLSMTTEGVNPSEFDDREPLDKPMGLYVFVHEQPYRNATASQYFDTNGAPQFIPAYDPATQTAIPRQADQPENLVLFQGYKDYVLLLQVMGQYIQHNAELARLRGMRQGQNDLIKARNAISQLQSETATDFLMLRRSFTNEFPAGDASGVNAAINGVEAAFADLTNVRGFINGTANLLGLDPNFLLLVQGVNLPGGFNNESFDILYSLLKGQNQPLGDALAKLTEATEEYQGFRASVDRVMADLGEVDATYEERHVRITGYRVNEVPGFNGLAKPNSGSELELVQQSIASLRKRNDTLNQLSVQIAKSVADAQAGVTIATNLDHAVDEAETIYINESKKAYNQIGDAQAAAAGLQSTFQAVAAFAALPGFEAIFDGPAVVLAGAAAGAANVAAAKLTADRNRDIEYLAKSRESTLQKADNALTVNQAKMELGAAQREQNANVLETTDNTLALAQVLNQQNALLLEVRRISELRESFSFAIRQSYYADPIHYVRAENALILADSAFRNAQRWIFYSQRALEYKWQQRFARTETSAQGIRSFDSGSVFKMRNATELNDLLTQLKAWNDDRLLQDSGNDHTTFISMLHDVLAPNPNVLNLTESKRADAGVRFDSQTGDLVSQIDLFHRRLTQGIDANGNLNIDFDTTGLDTLQADFFVGPNYTATTVAPGEWRDKIVYLKVNIIAEDGVAIPRNLAGSLTYGGQTFFRTRIPPCPDRSVVINSLDLPGEFFTVPFRFYNSPSYDNVFVSQDTQTASITAAYTGATAKSITGEETLATTYQINSFNQRSVAATRWRLTLFAPVTGWNVSKLRDIELIVRHHSSSRLAPVCN